ncbi:uncharacterized protein UV8b_05570 [Ustilaginoidea virens]|uniref:Uncharacterized protein n=1 Tax=Ustilaginoidea virens TaxID=1159556 RepID=A0A063C3B2_USTVR|nr:uncharacterized protein UV8b_05570 [Ustilaginoidea virens]QUC21327.1 hypothetical protein UV8b_05570 [Ustilaginoidea virens]GAO16213.1 hypothetical protein UVI_02044960 [Ustilaginoidea virens]
MADSTALTPEEAHVQSLFAEHDLRPNTWMQIGTPPRPIFVDQDMFDASYALMVLQRTARVRTGMVTRRQSGRLPSPVERYEAPVADKVSKKKPRGSKQTQQGKGKGKGKGKKQAAKKAPARVAGGKRKRKEEEAETGTGGGEAKDVLAA